MASSLGALRGAARREAERSLNRRFLDAVAAVSKARGEGRLTDAQADNLLRSVAATMARAKVGAMANRIAERLSAPPQFGGARIAERFASALESYKTRED